MTNPSTSSAATESHDTNTAESSTTATANTEFDFSLKVNPKHAYSLENMTVYVESLKESLSSKLSVTGEAEPDETIVTLLPPVQNSNLPQQLSFLLPLIEQALEATSQNIIAAFPLMLQPGRWVLVELQIMFAFESAGLVLLCHDPAQQIQTATLFDSTTLKKVRELFTSTVKEINADMSASVEISPSPYQAPRLVDKDEVSSGPVVAYELSKIARQQSLKRGCELHISRGGTKLGATTQFLEKTQGNKNIHHIFLFQPSSVIGHWSITFEEIFRDPEAGPFCDISSDSPLLAILSEVDPTTFSAAEKRQLLEMIIKEYHLPYSLDERYLPGALQLRTQQFFQVYDYSQKPGGNLKQAAFNFLQQSNEVPLPLSSPSLQSTSDAGASSAGAAVTQLSEKMLAARGKNLTAIEAAFWAARYNHSELFDYLLSHRELYNRKRAALQPKIAPLQDELMDLVTESDFNGLYFRILKLFLDTREVEVKSIPNEKPLLNDKMKWAMANREQDRLLLIYQEDKQLYHAADRGIDGCLYSYEAGPETWLGVQLENLPFNELGTLGQENLSIMVREFLVTCLVMPNHSVMIGSLKNIKPRLTDAFELTRANRLTLWQQEIEIRGIVYNAKTGESFHYERCTAQDKQYLAELKAAYEKTLEKYRPALVDLRDAKDAASTLPKTFEAAEERIGALRAKIQFYVAQMAQPEENNRAFEKEAGLKRLLSSSQAPILYDAPLDKVCQRLVSAVTVDAVNVIKRSLVQECIEFGSTEATLVLLRHAGLFLTAAEKKRYQEVSFKKGETPFSLKFSISPIVYSAASQVSLELVTLKRKAAWQHLEASKSNMLLGTNYLLIKVQGKQQWLFCGVNSQGRIVSGDVAEVPSLHFLDNYLKSNTKKLANVLAASGEEQYATTQADLLQLIRSHLGKPPKEKSDPFCLADKEGRTFLHQLISKGYMREAWEWIVVGASSHLNVTDLAGLDCFNTRSPRGETLLGYFLIEMTQAFKHYISLVRETAKKEKVKEAEAKTREKIKRVLTLVGRGADILAAVKKDHNALDLLEQLPLSLFDIEIQLNLTRAAREAKQASWAQAKQVSVVPLSPEESELEKATRAEIAPLLFCEQKEADISVWYVTRLADDGQALTQVPRINTPLWQFLHKARESGRFSGEDLQRLAELTAAHYGCMPSHPFQKALLALIYTTAAFHQIEVGSLSKFHQEVMAWHQKLQAKISLSTVSQQEFVAAAGALVKIDLADCRLNCVSVNKESALGGKIKNWEKKKSQQRQFLLVEARDKQEPTRWYFCGENAQKKEVRGYVDELPNFGKLAKKLGLRLLTAKKERPDEGALLALTLEALGFQGKTQRLLRELAEQRAALNKAYINLEASYLIEQTRGKTNLEAVAEYYPEEFKELQRYNSRALQERKTYAEYPANKRKEKERKKKPEESTQRVDEKVQRTESATQRADAAIQRADAATQRADAATQRAEEEARQKEEAIQRAEKLEARLKALEEQLSAEKQKAPTPGSQKPTSPPSTASYQPGFFPVETEEDMVATDEATKKDASTQPAETIEETAGTTPEPSPP